MMFMTFNKFSVSLKLREGMSSTGLRVKSNASVLTGLKSTSHTFAHDEIKARS